MKPQGLFPLTTSSFRFIQRGELELVGTHCITSSPPPIEEIFLGVERALRRKADMIVGYGGGSTLDAAKAIAALFGDAECKPGWVHKKNRERSEMEAAYEGGEGFYVMRLQRASKPLALIPSRPGSGSEVSDRYVKLEDSAVPSSSIRHLRGFTTDPLCHLKRASRLFVLISNQKRIPSFG